jgi:hypothetical protein
MQGNPKKILEKADLRLILALYDAGEPEEDA